jgi:hypothetical protein
VLEVDHYLCWGTPNDLKTFEYWQSCFHKWDSHPYRWQEDRWRLEFKEDGTSDRPNFSPLSPGSLKP